MLPTAEQSIKLGLHVQLQKGKAQTETGSISGRQAERQAEREAIRCQELFTTTLTQLLDYMRSLVAP